MVSRPKIMTTVYYLWSEWVDRPNAPEGFPLVSCLSLFSHSISLSIGSSIQDAEKPPRPLMVFIKELYIGLYFACQDPMSSHVAHDFRRVVGTTLRRRHMKLMLI